MAVTINGSTGVQLDDNDKQKLGTGNDLEIFHDGSNSYMANNTGVLVLQGNGSGQSIKINPKSGENSIVCVADGATNLYYNGAKKFETTGSGVDIAGNCTITGNFRGNDNVKLNLGNGDDLQLYHNGSHSYIDDTGTGQLIIKSDLVKLQGTNGEDYLQGHENGQVELYYNGVKKFETTSSGATVTGNLNLGDNGSVKWGAGNDLNIYHDGSTTNHITLASGQKLNISITGAGTWVQLAADGIFWTHHHRPWDDNLYDLGSSSFRWDDVYATNGTIQTSDKNEKNTIVDTDLGLSFVNKLKPVSYKFNGKTRTHYGLIAQDVETTLSDISKPTTDFAGFIKTDLPDELYTDRDTIPEGKKEGDVKTPAHTTYGLRYNEFISPLIKAVQELSAEVETLKTKVAALEAHTHE